MGSKAHILLPVLIGLAAITWAVSPKTKVETMADKIIQEKDTETVKQLITQNTAHKEECAYEMAKMIGFTRDNSNCTKFCESETMKTVEEVARRTAKEHKQVLDDEVNAVLNRAEQAEEEAINKEKELAEAKQRSVDAMLRQRRSTDELEQLRQEMAEMKEELAKAESEHKQLMEEIEKVKATRNEAQEKSKTTRALLESMESSNDINPDNDAMWEDIDKLMRTLQSVVAKRNRPSTESNAIAIAKAASTKDSLFAALSSNGIASVGTTQVIDSSGATNINVLPYRRSTEQPKLSMDIKGVGSVYTGDEGIVKGVRSMNGYDYRLENVEGGEIYTGNGNMALSRSLATKSEGRRDIVEEASSMKKYREYGFVHVSAAEVDLTEASKLMKTKLVLADKTGDEFVVRAVYEANQGKWTRTMGAVSNCQKCKTKEMIRFLREKGLLVKK